MVKKCMILLTLAGLMFAQGPFFEPAGGGGKQCKKKKIHHEMGDKHLMMLKEKLELSDGQFEKIKSIKTENKKWMVQTKADLKVLRIEKHELMSKKDISKRDVESKIDEIAKLRTKMEKKTLETKLAMRDVLSEEQREKFMNLRHSKPHQEKQKKKKHRRHMD